MKIISIADLTIEHSADIALMLSSCKDIESAEIPQQLALISQELRTTKNDEEFSRIKSKTGIEWLEKNCPTAYELLKEFLQKHSHRTYKEVNFIEFNMFQTKVTMANNFNNIFSLN